ncbi:beta-microseminoprotein-like [Gracilinanus agilis]|uniref:beta-microseminoprotein-like n=1 Tax=Gracilinanus agilis TaxID=191870 RepID=UPI001CFEB232|nr:beta-microseminoprotein-like [Gracilinanus agilis]
MLKKAEQLLSGKLKKIKSLEPGERKLGVLWPAQVNPLRHRPGVDALGSKNPLEERSCEDTMNTMLVVLLALAIFVTLCDAFCFMIPLKITREKNPKGCKDNDNIMHKFKSEWKTEKCENCVCDSRSGIKCCTNVLVPLAYDKTHCKTIFNKKKCRYSVVRKDNPKKYCRVIQYES